MVNCWLSNVIYSLKIEINKIEKNRNKIIDLINWLLNNDDYLNDIWQVEIKGLDEKLLTDDYINDLKESYKLKDYQYQQLKIMIKGCLLI